MSTALKLPPASPQTARDWASGTEPLPSYPFLTPASSGIGQLGDYLILGVLGTGGMGVVFLARDLSLDREVALKVIDPHAARDDVSRRYFLREARVMAAIEHENVVPIYRVGEANGVLFLAMPVLRGCTLETWLEESPERPLADVLRIGREVAAGLAAAHAKGLVHRDVKPANVWLEGTVGDTPKDGSHVPFTRVKILDFGLARPVAMDQQITKKEFVVGTPGYLAPELIQGAQPTPACDLFGLGALLYQCFAGEVPFQQETPLSTLLATVAQKPIELSERVPGLPSPVAELVMTLLAKNPLERPASAEWVAARLFELEHDPHCATTKLVTPPRPKPATPPRRAWLWQLVAAVIASVGVILAVLPFVGSRKPTPVEASDTQRTPERPLPAPETPKVDPLQPVGSFTGLTAPATGAAYLGDGSFLAIGEDGWVHQWQSDAPGESKRKWRAHPERGYGLAVGPKGRVLTGGNNAAGESVVVGWNLDKQEAVFTVLAGLTWTNSISINRDGTRAVATGLGGTAIVFDPRTGERWPAFETGEWLSGLAISPDGARAVSGSKWETFGRIWDVPNAKFINKLEGLTAGGGKAAAFSPDGKTVALGAADLLVRLWNVETGEAGRILYGHNESSQSLAFGPDGSRIASGSSDGTVRVWDVNTGNELAVFRGHTDSVIAVEFSPSGRQILSAGRDRRVFTWVAPK